MGAGVHEQPRLRARLDGFGVCVLRFTTQVHNETVQSQKFVPTVNNNHNQNNHNNHNSSRVFSLSLSTNTEKEKMSDELVYPNLTHCKVTLTGASSASSQPPVHLSSEILSAVQMTFPDEPHDFALGTYIPLQFAATDRTSSRSRDGAPAVCYLLFVICCCCCCS
jgi:hypothetical protein